MSATEHALEFQDEVEDEGTSLSKKDVQELQDHPTQRRGPGDLHRRTPAQATPGLMESIIDSVGRVAKLCAPFCPRP